MALHSNSSTPPVTSPVGDRSPCVLRRAPPIFNSLFPGHSNVPILNRTSRSSIASFSCCSTSLVRQQGKLATRYTLTPRIWSRSPRMRSSTTAQQRKKECHGQYTICVHPPRSHHTFMLPLKPARRLRRCCTGVVTRKPKLLGLLGRCSHTYLAELEHHPQRHVRSPVEQSIVSHTPWSPQHLQGGLHTSSSYRALACAPHRRQQNSEQRLYASLLHPLRL